MKNIKSGYKVKNFNKFITELELKEEFTCPIKGTCVMKDSDHGTCGVFVSDNCNAVTSCSQVTAGGECSIVASNGACTNYNISNSENFNSSNPVVSTPSSSSCEIVATGGMCNWYTYTASEGSSYSTCSQVKVIP